jgi:thymidylate kinase
MGIDEAGKRTQRQAFAELAHPQHGVDAMADQFNGTTPLAGVVDVAAGG